MSLSTIRQLAMDYVDEQTNPSSGKFSTAWWLRRINEAKNILAQETGFYQAWQTVAVAAGASWRHPMAKKKLPEIENSNVPEVPCGEPANIDTIVDVTEEPVNPTLPDPCDRGA